MRLSRFFPLISTLVLMSGCASVIDGPTQNITIATPGANEAECYLTNGVKYHAVTGETLRIMRSSRDLVADCYASGDRHKQVVVSSTFNGWGAANVTNAVVPGVTYDHYSGGLYVYPDVLTIDFVGMPTRGFESPAYMNKDAPNPYKQAIEPYSSTTPRLPQDSEYLRRGLEKRSTGVNSNPFSDGAGGAGMTDMPAAGGGSGATSESAVPAMSPSKPNLSGGTAEELTRSANPAVFNK